MHAHLPQEKQALGMLMIVNGITIAESTFWYTIIQKVVVRKLFVDVD